MAGQSCSLQIFLLLPLLYPVFCNVFGFQPITSESAVTSIYWNSSNILFTRNPASLLFTVHLRDKMDLICPHYKRGTLSEFMEVSLVYMVDRIGYESCSVNSNARLVGLCTSPYKKEVITIVFRRYTPNPGGLEFMPGRRYYLISASEGSMGQLQNTNGGLCLKKNMRLQLDVKERLPHPQEKSKVPKVAELGNLLPRMYSIPTTVRPADPPAVSFSRVEYDGLSRTASNEISDSSFEVEEFDSVSDVQQKTQRRKNRSSIHRLDNTLRVCLAVLFILSLIAPS